MRLYITLPSPYARKCRIVVREKDLAGRVEETVVDPYASDPELLAVNPVAQVPCLVDDEGVAWIDSPLICARLDEIGTGLKLIPPGEARWAVLRREALADAVLEMGVKWILELRRPEDLRSQHWIDRWTAGLGRALDALEREPLSAENPDIAAVTAGVAVSWLDFRHPTFDWRSGRPKLEALQSALERRPSFIDTTPR